METSKNGLSVVRSNAKYGLYVWQLPNGELFKDENNNILNIPSMEYDFNKMYIIQQAADYYGQPEGRAVFMPGVGRVTEEEYQEDLQRMNAGLLPLGDTEAWRDAARSRRQLDNRYQD
jgi:hypothetical protein